MKTQKIHRRYPEQNWDFKVISTRINDNGTLRDVNYYTSNTKEGVEVYSGENYIVGSKDKSYSRQFSMSKIPDKYKKIVAELKKVHKATKWSTAKRVDLN
jgi:transcriptional regulator of NAD metabolism